MIATLVAIPAITEMLLRMMNVVLIVGTGAPLSVDSGKNMQRGIYRQ
jgi:hypothetical protein